MRILVRNIETGMYYAGHNYWVGQSENGFDFQSTRRALEWITWLKPEAVELIYTCGGMEYDIVVPPSQSPQEDFGLG